MTEQLKEIGVRLAALRDVFDITAEEMSEKLGISLEEYLAYEGGKRDFSFSFLQNSAEILGVDILDIMSGDSPKLTTCTVIKKGQGYKVDRRAKYDYEHLAFTFRDKKAEPFIVTVEPDAETTPTLHGHEGQEFNYVLSGKMQFYIGEISYILEQGDSVYFNSAIPHAMRALENRTVKFLAVVLK